MSDLFIEEIKTPLDIKNTIDSMHYHATKTYSINTPKQTIHKGRGHCFDLTILAAYLNELIGNKPLVMGFQFKKKSKLIGHIVHYFQNEEGFNSIGKSRIPELGSKMNNYKTKETLIKDYELSYQNNGT